MLDSDANGASSLQFSQACLDPSVSKKAQSEIVDLTKTVEEIRDYFRKVLRNLEDLDNQSLPDGDHESPVRLEPLAPMWRKCSRVNDSGNAPNR